MLYSTPFILFTGTCAEAMTFYQNCFGGELTLTKLAPMRNKMPKELSLQKYYCAIAVSICAVCALK